MTTVRPLRAALSQQGQAAGKMLLALLVGLSPGLPLSAQSPQAHWLNAGAMPPGAIGSQRLLRGGPLFGYKQPVELRAPDGIEVSTASGECSATPHEGRLVVGLEVGPVYRFRAVGIPGFPRVEVFPTVELVDRLYPPAGKELEFPLPIELALEDLRLAAQGAFVTRVVYVEDPHTALPVEEEGSQQRFDARPGDDPLVLADELGRPVAIVRLGSRSHKALPDSRFANPILLTTHESERDPSAPAPSSGR